jgi:hypothetical protein
MPPERATVQFGSRRIDYLLHRSDRRKTINIAVDPVKGVFVTAPRDADAQRVQELVTRKARWIVGKLRAVEDLNADVSLREFISGESFLYLGRNHRLKVIPCPRAKVSVRMSHGRFEVEVDSRLSLRKRSEVIRGGLCRWYQDHATRRIAERVTILALRVGVRPPSILIRDQQKRWASCDRQGRLRFNWRIIMAPMSLVDYVIAHELCHLIRHDHSPAFWKLLRTVMPDYEQRRERLRREGPRFWF